MLLRISAMPLAEIRLVLPSGAPWSTIDAWCCSTHAFHASMPAFSFASRCAGSSDFHPSMASGEPVKMARKFFMAFS